MIPIKKTKIIRSTNAVEESKTVPFDEFAIPPFKDIVLQLKDTKPPDSKIHTLPDEETLYKIQVTPWTEVKNPIEKKEILKKAGYYSYVEKEKLNDFIPFLTKENSSQENIEKFNNQFKSILKKSE
jgi:hypothetical protein